MRDLSHKIISGDPRRSENTQTLHITIQYQDIKVEVKSYYTLKCHVLEFPKDEAKRALQKTEQSFAEAVFSHVNHTLFTLEERGVPRMTYAYESQ
jgi:hypothetical protein